MTYFTNLLKWSIIALVLFVDIAFLQDSGSIETCGDGTSSKFSVIWSPKKVRIGGTTAVDIDLLASTDLPEVGGQVCFTVWMADSPDPIVQRHCSDLTCLGVHKFLAFMPCPIKKGDHFSTSLKVPVDSSYPIPTGDFIVKVEVYNGNGTMFLCSKAQLIIYED